MPPLGWKKPSAAPKEDLPSWDLCFETRGFVPLDADESRDFVMVRSETHASCAQQLQLELDNALDSLNQKVFGEIPSFLRASTLQLQRAWRAAAPHEPPYAELSAAVVAADCSAGDRELQMKQLLAQLSKRCSRHRPAVLRSRECATLPAAVRSLVSQLMAESGHISNGCSFDMSVLSGWHADLARMAAIAAKVSAPSVEMTETPRRPDPVEDDPFLVVIDDAEHFSSGVLDGLVHLCSHTRSVNGLMPLPIAFVLPISSAVSGGLSQLFKRSSLVLLKTRHFSLSSTDAAVDALASRLMLSPALPLLSAAGCSFLMRGLSDGHRSSAAFASQLQFALLRNFRTRHLSFLPPLYVLAPGALADAEAIAASMGDSQLRALRALPSVRVALTSGSRGSRGVGATDAAFRAALRAALPSFLFEQGLARLHRQLALRCLLLLLRTCFGGAHGPRTSARALYSELSERRPLLKCQASVVALEKLRQASLPPDTLDAMLLSWQQYASAADATVNDALLQCERPEGVGELQAAAIAQALEQLGAVISGTAARDAAAVAAGAPTAPSPTAAAAPPAARPSAAMRRQQQLAAARGVAAAATSGGRGATAAAAWLEAQLAADTSETLPLNELWRNEEAEAEELEASFGVWQPRALKAALATIGAKAAAAAAANRTAAAAVAPPPAAAGRKKRPRTSEGAGSSADAGAEGDESRESAKVELAPEWLPRGWETAALYQALGEESRERLVGVVELFDRFSQGKLGVASGLERAALMPHFVLALQQLRHIGFVKASRRHRGAIEKKYLE